LADTLLQTVRDRVPLLQVKVTRNAWHAQSARRGSGLASDAS